MDKELKYSEKFHDYTLSIHYPKKWIELIIWSKQEEGEHDHKIEFTVESKEEAIEVIQALQKVLLEFPDET